MPTLSEKHWTMTVDIMREEHKASPVTLSVVENFLHRMTTEQLSSCMCCGLQLQTLFLLPCACTICTECITCNTIACPICEKNFDPDEFQLLQVRVGLRWYSILNITLSAILLLYIILHINNIQPGLDYIWKWNLMEAEKRRERSAYRRQIQNESGRLIENQGSSEIVDLSDNDEEIGVEIAQPIQQHIIRPTRRRRKLNHQCIYPSTFIDGKCTICFQMHNGCNFLNDSSCCTVCHARAEECPKDESKAYYVTNKFLQLWKSSCTRHDDAKNNTHLKVIVFSQFRQILNVVGDRLIRRFGGGCISEYWGTTRNQELDKFSKDRQCFCMLLGLEGSHGLDLSFVTHIFFLDEILDKSVESQVVARAYRMGASQAVKVEQLVASNSIEELIVERNKRDGTHDALYSNSESCETKGEFIQSSFGQNNISAQEKKDQHAKRNFLLSNLTLIKCHHQKSISKTKKGKLERRVKFDL